MAQSHSNCSTFLQHLPQCFQCNSPFLLHFGRECSNPLWNKLNPGNTTLRQGDITTSVHELHKLWKAHAAEIRKKQMQKRQFENRQRPTFEIRRQSSNHELQLTWFRPKILQRLEDLEVQLRPTGHSPEPGWRPQNTVHMTCKTDHV